MEKWAIVVNTIGSLKSKASFASELADEALLGMVVEVLSEEGEWSYVKTPYNYSGYILNTDLNFDGAFVDRWRESKIHIIDHTLVDVMDRPKYEGQVVELLTRGANIVLTGKKEDKWIQILLPDNRKGWIIKKYIKEYYIDDKSNENALRKKIVENAKVYLGTQYRWGGKTPIGIDCSGLCSMSYMLEGIIIYRDAILKEEYMRSITREEMKEGDLLFWKGHVAMYIGEDKFIHSTSSSAGVVINSLNPIHHDYRGDLAENIELIGSIF